MTFALLNLVMLALAAAGAGIALRGSRPRGPWLSPFLLTAAGLAVLTLVFDNLMIAANLFDYGAEHRSGILVGRAPIEDLAYPLGALVLLPALWHRLTHRDGRDDA